MYNTQRKNFGFTIVELLVVIVVIALLAAITTVTFRYVQARAYDSKMASGFSQFGKLIEMHFSETGGYPSAYSVDFGYVCIGEREHYPAIDGWAEGACYGERQPDGSMRTLASVDNDLTSSLRRYASQIPNISYQPVDIGGGGSGTLVRGPFYSSSASHQYIILYYANYSGNSGGKACLWGGILTQIEDANIEACLISKSRA